MDLDNVFGLFGHNRNDIDPKKEMEARKELDLLKDTPKFKVGMFTKMIFNGINFRKQVVKFFTSSSAEIIGKDGLEEVGDYMMYTRAYFWIQDCNLKKEEWRNAVEYYSGDFGHIELITCLKLAIKHFEELEEFERCAFLKNIQDYTENYLQTETPKEA